MIKPLIRCKSSSISKYFHITSKPKVFSRQTQNEDEKISYQDGVTQILSMRRTLSLSRDTTFLAIDMFKGCLKKKLVKNSKNIQELYVACIFIAAKTNEVLNLSVEEAIEGCDCFVKKEDIYRMQSRILNLYEYDLPYDQNLALVISGYLNTAQDRKNIQNKCFKTLLDSLNDPYFMNVDNKSLAIASLCIHCPEQAKKLGLVNKTLIPIIGKLKQIEKEKNKTKEYLFKERTII